MQRLWLFIRLSRPHFLLGAALLYALGVGIAHYLGTAINWELYFLGQAWVSMLQLATHYLNDYFDAAADADNPNRTPFSGGSGALGPGKLTRQTALLAAYVCLAITASLTVLVIHTVGLSPALLFVMTFALFGALAYSVPPLQLASSGYGELVTSILVANLVPVFGFLLQRGELHRLLAMSTFPLTALNLAMMLIFELADYPTDLKYGKRTLMIRAGWENGMLFHNLLILSAYILLGLAAILGMPMALALPAFLTLPIGLFQIRAVNRIAAGAKPNWFSLCLVAVALLASTAYLLAFGFWTR